MLLSKPYITEKKKKHHFNREERRIFILKFFHSERHCIKKKKNSSANCLCYNKCNINKIQIEDMCLATGTIQNLLKIVYYTTIQSYATDVLHIYVEITIWESYAYFATLLLLYSYHSHIQNVQYGLVSTKLHADVNIGYYIHVNTSSEHMHQSYTQRNLRMYST